MTHWTNAQIAFLELALIGGIGLLIAISGLLVNLVQNRRNERCTATAVGTVTGHRFYGEGRMAPVIEFRVDGVNYRTVKRFNGFKIVSSSIPKHPEVYEDEKGYLCVRRGPVMNTREAAETLWPVGSTRKVYYVENKPKIHYVERPVTNRLYSIISISTGVGIMLLSVGLFFVIKNG